MDSIVEKFLASSEFIYDKKFIFIGRTLFAIEYKEGKLIFNSLDTKYIGALFEGGYDETSGKIIMKPLEKYTPEPFMDRYEIYVNVKGNLTVDHIFRDKLVESIEESIGDDMYVSISKFYANEFITLYPKSTRMERREFLTKRANGSILQRMFEVRNGSGLIVDRAEMFTPKGVKIAEFNRSSNSITYFNLDNPNEKFTIIRSGDKPGCMLEKDEKQYALMAKTIITKIFEDIIKNTVDFHDPNSRLPDLLSEAYLFLHAENHKKFYFFFFGYGKDLGSKESLQKRIFESSDMSNEFKVIGVPNLSKKHALVAIVPNPNLHPNKKIIIIDTANSPEKYKGDLYIDFSISDSIVVPGERCSIQEGNVCAILAVSAAIVCGSKTLAQIEELASKKTDIEITEVDGKKVYLSELQREILADVNSRFKKYTKFPFFKYGLDGHVSSIGTLQVYF